MSNLGRMPVALYPGMRIWFVYLRTADLTLVGAVSQEGVDKYAGQERPLASKLASETSK
ncbi:MAG: hypothetical protein WDO18_15920 [Acidobacteriota bacterium]